MTSPELTISSAMDTFFRPYLAAHGGVESWSVWRAVLKSLYGEKLTAAELEDWRRVTGRQTPRKGGYSRAYYGVGRSSGKTTVAALDAAYQAILHARGRRADLLLVAQDLRRSAAFLETVRDLLEGSPFAAEIESTSSKDLRIGHARVIALPSTSCSLRGFHGPRVYLDELAHLRGAEGRYNDKELVRAAVPAVRAFNGVVLGLSSPNAESGLLYEMAQAHKGNENSDTLYVYGPTWIFNKTITELDARADAGEDSNLLAEYAATFQSNLQALLDESVIESLPGDYQSLLPQDGVTYKSFVDMSGARSDSAVLAIGHLETRDGKRRATVDLVDEIRSPFDAEQAVERFASLCRAYRVGAVHGDGYAGSLYSQMFDRNHVRYQQAPLDASGLYQSFAISCRSGQVVVPNNATLLRQLRHLEEKRTASKVVVRHASAHDDVANGVAGVIHMLLGRREPASVVLPDSGPTQSIGGTTPPAEIHRDAEGQLWSRLRPEEEDQVEGSAWGTRQRSLWHYGFQKRRNGKRSPWDWE